MSAIESKVSAVDGSTSNFLFFDKGAFPFVCVGWVNVLMWVVISWNRSNSSGCCCTVVSIRDDKACGKCCKPCIFQRAIELTVEGLLNELLMDLTATSRKRPLQGRALNCLTDVRHRQTACIITQLL